MSWRPSAQRPKKTVRDFHRRRYGNPLFQRGSSTSRARATGSRQGTGLGRAAWPILGAALGLTAFAYLLWGPVFAVKKVAIVGAALPATEETVLQAVSDYADGLVFGIFPRRNIFLFHAAAARAAVEEKVFLEDLQVDKKLPNTITVTIVEKTPKAVLEHDGRLYALDASGFLIRELSESEMTEMNDLPPGMSAVSVPGLGAETVVVDATKPEGDAVPAARTTNVLPLVLDQIDPSRPVSLRPGSQAAPASTVAMILEAYGRLPDIIGDTVRWFEKGEDGKSVSVTTGGNWKIHLSTALPFDAQAERLGIVLREKVGDRVSQLEYVDLRYNEKIYYRMKGGGETP